MYRAHSIIYAFIIRRAQIHNYLAFAFYFITFLLLFRELRWKEEKKIVLFNYQASEQWRERKRERFWDESKIKWIYEIDTKQNSLKNGTGIVHNSLNLPLLLLICNNFILLLLHLFLSYVFARVIPFNGESCAHFEKAKLFSISHFICHCHLMLWMYLNIVMGKKSIFFKQKSYLFTGSFISFIRSLWDVKRNLCLNCMYWSFLHFAYRLLATEWTPVMHVA